MALPQPEPFGMSLEEAMRTQRAIRRLKPDPVDDALILKCIELALKAPTGSNAQNWEFVVVKDPAVKAKLARLNRLAWSAYGGIGRFLARRAGDDQTSPAYPGEAFTGRVSFIEPFLDDKTRSVKIRCDIPNQQLKLRPSMYVNARIRIPVEELEGESGRYVSGLDYSCPNHPEIISSRPGICPEDNVPFIKSPPAQVELVAADTVPSGQEAYEYICPMKCYSSKDPGDCPVCKMKLEKVPVSKSPQMAVETETVYVCPMGCHTSKTDGDCPVCGMRLEKKEIPAEVSDEKLMCICPQEWEPSIAPRSCPMCGMMLQKSVTITLPTGEKKQNYVYMCPMACMTSEKPGECPDCKRQMGRWEVKDGLGIKVQKIEPKRRSVYACTYRHSDKIYPILEACVDLVKKEWSEDHEDHFSFVIGRTGISPIFKHLQDVGKL